MSEIAIPFDRVDEEAIAGPVKWDVKFIERFMLVFGPVSSVFDFLTFYVLLYLFGAGEALFQTGWFIESITTQVLVVFAIRTRRSVFRSRPHCSSSPWRLELSLSQSLFRCSRSVGGLGSWRRRRCSSSFLVGATLAYLAIVEVTKRVFYRVMAAQSSRLETIAHTSVPNKAPTPAVMPMASAPQKVTLIAPGIMSAPPARAANAPSSARKSSEVPDTE